MRSSGSPGLHVNLTRDEESGTPEIQASPSSSFMAAAARMPRFLSRSVSHDSPFFRPDDDAEGLPHSRPSRRLVRRDSPFHQSSGKIYMRRGMHRGLFAGLLRKDWYHVLLTVKSRWLLLGILTFFTLVVVAFAVLFMIADGPISGCSVGRSGERATFYNAFFFSLETFTTIGYGVPYDDRRVFFNSCPAMLVIIYFEATTFMLVNAMIVGLFIGKLSRASSRANQIIFSDKASICCVRNRFYFMFQACEASFFSYRPVVEAHVRVYAVLHEQDPSHTERAFFQTRVMRLTNPNDELGGVLFLATPQVVTHCIDQWSPLFPPRALPAHGDDVALHDGAAYHFPGVVYRMADREVAMADEGRVLASTMCNGAVCSDTAPGSSDSAASPHLRPAVGEAASEAELLAMQHAIRKHLVASDLEVIVVLEGIDPHTSNTFQARQSYTAADIVFDEMFVPSLSVGRDGQATFDWSAFHRLQRVPFNRKHLIFGAHS